jgi:5'-3' exonuclease
LKIFIKRNKVNKKQFEEAGIRERIINLLIEGEEEANFSKMLGTIRLDAPVDFSLPEKTWKESIDPEKVISVWSNLEFRTLGARLKALLGISNMEYRMSENISNNKKDESTQNSIFSVQYSDEKVRELSIMLWLINQILRIRLMKIFFILPPRRS